MLGKVKKGIALADKYFKNIKKKSENKKIAERRAVLNPFHGEAYKKRKKAEAISAGSKPARNKIKKKEKQRIKYIKKALSPSMKTRPQQQKKKIKPKAQKEYEKKRKQKKYEEKWIKSDEGIIELWNRANKLNN